MAAAPHRDQTGVNPQRPANSGDPGSCAVCHNLGLLQTRAADPGLRHECTRVLDDAAAAGITVLRLWAFADGDEWNALQAGLAAAATSLGQRRPCQPQAERKQARRCLTFHAHFPNCSP